MPSTPEEKKKILTRVCRTRGQIDALERSLEGNAKCRVILQQIVATRGAANGLMAEVLESYIRETFDQNDCYSREIGQPVDDTTELVRAYPRQLNLLPYWGRARDEIMCCRCTYSR